MLSMMSNPISYITANLVAKELGFSMGEGWMQGYRATMDVFKPLDTFAAKFEEILFVAKDSGFEAVDLWIAHLHPEWASDEHLCVACELLNKHELKVFSLAGSFGENPETLADFCRVAHAVGAQMLAGSIGFWRTDRPAVIDVLRAHRMKWAFENHPDEKTAQDVLDMIGTGDEDMVGVACDTGWFGTNDCDALVALRELAPRLMHIHLKDVREVGQHRTCSLGEGIVGIEAVVKTLRELGYGGPIGIEHEPESYDPTEEIRQSHTRLKAWMAAEAKIPPAF